MLLHYRGIPTMVRFIPLRIAYVFNAHELSCTVIKISRLCYAFSRMMCNLFAWFSWLDFVCKTTTPNNFKLERILLYPRKFNCMMHIFITDMTERTTCGYWWNIVSRSHHLRRRSEVMVVMWVGVIRWGLI